ncbi:ROK family protein [Chelatococcus reniformis]|uniref:Glucokinase n=1 Tax=Chelatococcus reniformis TaxID=1494448 RepID=A0A916TZ09_9HYPH|nr:ROK family protein [Chelatococcus reniformis]GGC45678.1 glucokinase [Chelatococcus reniformis]
MAKLKTDKPKTEKPAEANGDAASSGLAGHGASRLSAVVVDSYNLEVEDKNGFVGDRASGRAFRAMLDDIRKALKKTDEDPLGETPSAKISKRKLDKVLRDGDPEAAGVVHGAVEHFAGELAYVIRRFLKAKPWADTQRIVVGGGLRESRVGELAVGRAAVLIKSEGIDVDLEVIRHHPDEAGLIGCAHLAPSWVYEGHDSVLTVDVGGSNIRCGIVDLKLKAARDLSKAEVWKAELWRHREEKPGREEAVERLVDMLRGLIKSAAKDGRSLCPLVGIGVPGVIEPDGSIARGGQNLPGNWESSRFNLAASLTEAIPTIGDHETVVVMHNDAVVQGLSQTPFMQDVEHWGVLTIGTGLGNARFTNRNAKSD